MTTLSYTVITRGCAEALPFIAQHARRFSDEIVVGIDRFWPDDGTFDLATTLADRVVEFKSSRPMGHEGFYKDVLLASSCDWAFMGDDDHFVATSFSKDMLIDSPEHICVCQMDWITKVSGSCLIAIQRPKLELHRIFVQPKMIREWSSSPHAGGFLDGCSRSSSLPVVPSRYFHLETLIKSKDERIEIGKQHAAIRAGAERYDLRIPEDNVKSYKEIDIALAPQEMIDYLKKIGRIE